MVVGDDSGTPSQRSLRLRHLCDQLARALRCANRAKCSATIFFAVFTGSPTRRRLPSICRSLEEPNNILGARKNGGIRPSFPGVISQKARRGHLSGNRCQLRRSTQHLRGVYSQESGILGFFLDVDSSAARPGRAALERWETGQPRVSRNGVPENLADRTLSPESIRS